MNGPRLADLEVSSTGELLVAPFSSLLDQWQGFGTSRLASVVSKNCVVVAALEDEASIPDAFYSTAARASRRFGGKPHQQSLSVRRERALAKSLLAQVIIASCANAASAALGIT
jgi:hypothetical protein